MKKVVDSKFVLRSSCVAEQIESEQFALVASVVTEYLRVSDLAALYQSRESYELREFGLQIQLVALMGDKKYVAFTAVQHAQKFRYINVVQTKDRRHHSAFLLTTDILPFTIWQAS